MTSEEVSVKERCTDYCSNGNSSSCISEALDIEQLDDDSQFLSLLDAMDHLLCSRDSLAKSLSQGWIEIASARYSMGPSRIDQAIFSLKPCSASTLVSVSAAKDFAEDEGLLQGHAGEDDQECGNQCNFQFSLRSPCKDDQDNKTTTLGGKIANLEAFPQSNLRQRHISGSANKQHADDDSKGSINHVLGNESEMAQEGDMHPKQRSDALSWFGTLVSPHLRGAQTSFREALETLAELATTQNKVLAAYHQIKQGGGLV